MNSNLSGRRYIFREQQALIYMLFVELYKPGVVLFLDLVLCTNGHYGFLKCICARFILYTCS